MIQNSSNKNARTRLTYNPTFVKVDVSLLNVLFSTSPDAKAYGTTLKGNPVALLNRRGTAANMFPVENVAML